MNKREIVEVQAKFLEFCDACIKLGYTFDYGSRIELHHSSETKHSVGGKVTLDPTEFVEKTETTEN